MAWSQKFRLTPVREGSKPYSFQLSYRIFWNEPLNSAVETQAVDIPRMTSYKKQDLHSSGGGGQLFAESWSARWQHSKPLEQWSPIPGSRVTWYLYWWYTSTSNVNMQQACLAIQLQFSCCEVTTIIVCFRATVKLSSVDRSAVM